jgi:hypothetical protein
MSETTDTPDTPAPPVWAPPPGPVTWELDPPLKHNGGTYVAVTLRAPTAGDVLKATAVRGASGMEVTLRMISSISGEGVPYEALLLLPAWMVDQMSGYLDSFNGAPPPLPLRRTASPT